MKKTGANTLLGHWLADVHLAGFALALASLIFNSPYRSTTANTPLPTAGRRKPPVPIASVVRLRKN